VGSNPILSFDVCVSVSSLCIVLCVDSEGLGRSDPRPRGPIDCVQDQRTEKVVKTQQRDVGPKVSSPKQFNEF
jgi:hypothetical protein